MRNLFQQEAVDEVIARIDTLQPTTQRQWGKMDVAQMLAHCAAALDMASGRLNPPRLFIGRVLGPFVKPIYTNVRLQKLVEDAQRPLMRSRLQQMLRLRPKQRVQRVCVELIQRRSSRTNRAA